jgi:ribulose-5-phosphate 4-epimerase/fuculose-1-phosphate aldolase
MSVSRDERIAEFIAACRQAASAGLVRASSGNMSCRLDQDLMAVTAKGAWLARMNDAAVAVSRITDGVCVNGRTPSVESAFHTGILRARPDVNVVLHCQSPCATAVACGQREDLDFNVIPEVPFHVGAPALVDYFDPGSPELADAVIAALTGRDLALLRNHGQVVVGKDFDAVLQKAVFFELACEILLHGKCIRPMPREGIDALRARAEREHGRRTI